ncbi:gfo/Idh/MocA family oxidoreductase [Chryseobacterium piscium]|uniref:Gfo/Idh/MocA family oxidoreductase n=1 Tax=Chryseobacterium piscium TaxID=333702 RepID=A0A3D9BD35_9FLAO|nr:Gfo/Idh/MocA family oxidoreductase [Chryseobacterium piscium]REC51461.1 gfo/Idh/MocA family oxidoreductase [Chryseobacterium piscium]
MKILIVGLGSIAKKHISAIRKIDKNAVIYALRSSMSNNSEEKIQNIYSLDELSDEKLDFAIISNPTSNHFESIQQLSKLKIPLFIEKPLFSEVSDKTNELVQQIEDSGLMTYVACNLRFLDALTFIKKKLKGKRVNEVNVYCGSYLPDWRPGVDFRSVYSANKAMGGGVHIDLIHELDYVYWFFGKPQNTQSYFSNRSSLDITAFDYANYLWNYKGFSANIVLNYYRKDSKRTFEIVTGKGTYLADLLANKVYFNNELIFESEQKIIDTYESQMRFFIDNNDKKDKFNSISEANTILKLCMQD